MKYIKNGIFLLAVAVSLSSCGTDWFTPVVSVDIPAHEPKLVLYANWQAGSDSLLVFVSQSRGSLDSTPFMVDSLISRPSGRNNFNIPFQYDTVAGAVVEVYRNDVLFATLPRVGSGFYALYGGKKIDSTGNAVFKIRVTAPKFTTAEAAQPVFRLPKITNLTYTKDGAIYTNPNNPLSTPQKGDQFAIEYADPTDETNYYDILSAWFDYKDANGVQQSSRTFIPRSIDVLSENEVLSDGSFNGKTYKWLLWGQNRDYFGGSKGGQNGGPNSNTQSFQSGDRLTMTLRTFNKDWFLFKKSRQLLQSAQKNVFFSEPVLLHTNVKNGYGIFFLNAERKVTIVL